MTPLGSCNVCFPAKLSLVREKTMVDATRHSEVDMFFCVRFFWATVFDVPGMEWIPIDNENIKQVAVFSYFRFLIIISRYSYLVVPISLIVKSFFRWSTIYAPCPKLVTSSSGLFPVKLIQSILRIRFTECCHLEALIPQHYSLSTD
jgi:hypothetical protein